MLEAAVDNEVGHQARDVRGEDRDPLALHETAVGLVGAARGATDRRQVEAVVGQMCGGRQIRVAPSHTPKQPVGSGVGAAYDPSTARRIITPDPRQLAAEQQRLNQEVLLWDTQAGDVVCRLRGVVRVVELDLVAVEVGQTLERQHNIGFDAGGLAPYVGEGQRGVDDVGVETGLALQPATLLLQPADLLHELALGPVEVVGFVGTDEQRDVHGAVGNAIVHGTRADLEVGHVRLQGSVAPVDAGHIDPDRPIVELQLDPVHRHHGGVQPDIERGSEDAHIFITIPPPADGIIRAARRAIPRVESSTLAET